MIPNPNVIDALVLTRQYAFVRHVIVENRYAMPNGEIASHFKSEARQRPVAEAAVAARFAATPILVQPTVVQRQA